MNLPVFFASLFVTMWLGWLAVWIAMAHRVKQTAEVETLASRLSHLIPLLIAGGLLSFRVPLPILNERFVPYAVWPATLGAALTFAGLAFCIWARFVLAGNWSGDVELKRDHALVVKGPYRWVRHPIYTGLLLAFIGTALAVGETRAILAVAIAALSFWRKLRREEAVMRRAFGDAYGQYAARVPALIPFLA